VQNEYIYRINKTYYYNKNAQNKRAGYSIRRFIRWIADCVKRLVSLDNWFPLRIGSSFKESLERKEVSNM